MFHIVLFEPRIAPNTGNIMRLVANNGCTLHLIEPLGFDLEEKKLRRAGLDYRDLQAVHIHPDFSALVSALPDHRIIACTTRATQDHTRVAYQPRDILLFGSETSGLSEDVHLRIPPEQKVRIPMMANNRSMNLSNAVAIISYEAWRQNGFIGGD